MFQKYITLEQTLHQSSLPNLSTEQKQKRKYLTLICPKNLKQSKIRKNNLKYKKNENYGLIYTTMDLLVDILENMYYKKLLN